MCGDQGIPIRASSGIAAIASSWEFLERQLPQTFGCWEAGLRPLHLLELGAVQGIASAGKRTATKVAMAAREV